MAYQMFVNGKLKTISPEALAKAMRSGDLKFDSKKGFVPKGWTNESARHSMASYGIKTGTKSQFTPKKVGKKYMLIDNNTKQFLIGYSFDSKKDAEAFPEVKKEENMKVPQSLLDAQTQLYAGRENVSKELINEAKREIMNKRTENGEVVDDIDFMNMNNKAMAFSLLSDAQESINVGNSENAKLFVRQASQLLMGDYKRKGDKYHPEITFNDGTVALF